MEFLVLSETGLSYIFIMHSREITSFAPKSLKRHQVGLAAHRKLVPSQCGCPQALPGEVSLLVAMPRPVLLLLCLVSCTCSVWGRASRCCLRVYSFLSPSKMIGQTAPLVI